MSTMNSIEDTDGHYRIVQRSRKLGQIIDDLHDGLSNLQYLTVVCQPHRWG